MKITPQARAKQLVAANKGKLSDLFKGDINIRRDLLEVICVEVDPTGARQLKAGLLGLYLSILARQTGKDGDKEAYDLFEEFGGEVNTPRPKRPGGLAANAARDFAVDYLSTLLRIEYPELFGTANSATGEGVSAVDIIRQAIEGAGLGCIDYRASTEDAPVPRSMEQAIRRFRQHDRHRELYWPEPEAIDELGPS
jgi:hypothetical protein